MRVSQEGNDVYTDLAISTYRQGENTYLDLLIRRYLLERRGLLGRGRRLRAAGRFLLALRLFS